MNHKGTVSLTTRRLLLARFTVGDAGAMYGNWASDTEVTRYLTWPAHKSQEETARFLERLCADYDSPQSYEWAIRLRTGELIGSIGLSGLNAQTSSAWVGYCLGRRWWGNGYAAEALREVARFLLEDVGLDRLCAIHDVKNPNSGKVMAKAGFAPESLRRGAGFDNSGVCDICEYIVRAGDPAGPAPLKFRAPVTDGDREFVSDAIMEVYGSRPTAALDRETAAVAFVGARRAGACAVSASGKDAAVRLLYLAPGWRSRGLGAALTDLADGWGREKGLERLLVSPEGDNTAALRFLEKNGFTRLEEAGKPVFARAVSPCPLTVMTSSDYFEASELWSSSPGMGLNDVDDSPGGIAGFLARNPGTSFVARRGGELVGVILCGHDGRRGHVYHTAVSVKFRREGIGSALFRAACAALRARGVTKLSLTAFARNTPAVAFWQAQGLSVREDLTYLDMPLVMVRRFDT